MAVRAARNFEELKEKHNHSFNNLKERNEFVLRSVGLKPSKHELLVNSGKSLFKHVKKLNEEGLDLKDNKVEDYFRQVSGLARLVLSLKHVGSKSTAANFALDHAEELSTPEGRANLYINENLPVYGMFDNVARRKIAEGRALRNPHKERVEKFGFPVSEEGVRFASLNLDEAADAMESLIDLGFELRPGNRIHISLLSEHPNDIKSRIESLKRAFAPVRDLSNKQIFGWESTLRSPDHEFDRLTKFITKIANDKHAYLPPSDLSHLPFVEIFKEFKHEEQDQQ
ncbi:MAG: hypothetical protein GOV15_03725 [Candidatus Diapherotrites archaeon]|nr:hypothetical protein [Candidatus Diapherotrites archaeon]